MHGKQRYWLLPSYKTLLEWKEHQHPRTNKLIKVASKALKGSFEHYFPTDQKKVLDDIIWVLNVFRVKKKPPSSNSAEFEVIIDSTSHGELKIPFQNQSLLEFWLNLYDEYKILSEKAKLVLVPFLTTFFCDTVFSKIQKPHKCRTRHSPMRYRNMAYFGDISYCFSIVKSRDIRVIGLRVLFKTCWLQHKKLNQRLIRLLPMAQKKR